MSIEITEKTILVDEQVLIVLLSDNYLVDIHSGGRTILNKQEVATLIAALQAMHDKMGDV